MRRPPLRLRRDTGQAATLYSEIPLLHIDNFTLLVCLCSAAILLASAFAGVWFAQRSSRAPVYFSAAFFAGAASCVLFLLPPHTGGFYRFLNVVVGDSLVCVFLVVLQAGVRSYLGITRHRGLIWLPLLAAVFALVYYTNLHDSMYARIIVLGVLGFVVRVQIGMDLIAHAYGRSYRLLANVMFLFAVVSLWQVVGTLFRGAPTDYFRQDLVQSSVLFCI